MTEPRNRSVTIDDLLKLKRAEAPPAEFWSQFERELREKQLAAIVEKRPWWCALPGVYVFVVRRRLSLAAGASALTIGLLSFNVYHDARSGADLAAPDAQVAAVSAPEMAAPAVAALSVAPSAARPVPAALESMASTDRSARPAARLAVASTVSVPAIPLLYDMPPSGATERFGALSRSLSGELATSNVSVPGARTLLVGMRDFGARVIPTRTASADPLAQMQAPAEHRSRLLAEAYPTMASAGELIAPPSERVLSSLSDDRLYSTGNRFDLSSEHDAVKLSIRF
jgi:hypothetical protein